MTEHFGEATLALVPATSAAGARAKIGGSSIGFTFGPITTASWLVRGATALPEFAIEVLDADFYKTTTLSGWEVGFGMEAYADLLQSDDVSVALSTWPSPPLPTIQASFDQVYTGGAKITAIVTGGMADLAGLLVNDVITECNLVPIDSAADLEAVLATSEPGDTLALVVDRP